ncbi:hypothetical protein NP233_g1718 [Leucocoprinus birnbaumii]|uniref:Uncharacterized protein n=1 Tax=Leucocoprinus birnbaumii TaxID=56174 RepID=A0AAD5YZB1_9AGAR|nr:hypothetical protein NP233_g1718 [Leucocoprinus birnbaumii]
MIAPGAMFHEGNGQQHHRHSTGMEYALEKLPELPSTPNTRETNSSPSLSSSPPLERLPNLPGDEDIPLISLFPSGSPPNPFLTTNPVKGGRRHDLNKRARRSQGRPQQKKIAERLTIKTMKVYVSCSPREEAPDQNSQSALLVEGHTNADQNTLIDQFELQEPPLLIEAVEQGPKEHEYEAYLEAALANCAGFSQIARGMCVVQGWDWERKQSTNHWYRLQFIQTGEELRRMPVLSV